MFGEDTLYELRNSFFLAEQERKGGMSAHVSPFAGIADMGGLVQAAGFQIPTVDTDEIEVNYRDPFFLMRELQGMGENNASIARERNAISKDVMVSAAAIYQHLYGKKELDNTVPATFQLIWMIGWSPDSSQPKPKRRGSAMFSMKELQEGLEGDGLKLTKEMAQKAVQEMLEEEDVEEEEEEEEEDKGKK